MDRRLRQRLSTLFAILLCGPWSAVGAGVFDELERLTTPAVDAGQRRFLPPDEAFVLGDRATADGALRLEFTIAPGYYLYRDKFAVRPMTPGLELAVPTLPPGESKDDPEFGKVRIFRERIAFDVAVEARPPGSLLEAEVTYQGCAEDGICYPPIKKTVALADRAAAPPTKAATDAGEGMAGGLAPSARLARDMDERPLVWTVVSFVGLGLLLAFTPCVLPMVPILSGIIVGQRQPLSTWRAFGLSTTYVIAMALAYAAAGVVAGLLGRNLQAAFQHPAVIGGFAGIFVLLALAMFGVYELALPAVLQRRLDAWSRRQRGGSYAGVAAMGLLSAIIVGPCVAPPLAGALAYIGQTGSATVGASALFALGLGMGLPLIVLGTSAGVLLPRTGAWMVTVKRVFGVILLGVAIWFLARIVSGPTTLFLWALLALGCAFALGALERPAQARPVRARMAQAAGFAALVYGATLIVGAAAGGEDPLAPLAPLAGTRGAVAAPSFTPVKAAADVTNMVAAAAADGKVVMLDVYADWCIECVHLERRTFAHPEIAPRLAGLILLRADVTADDPTDRALLAHFGLYGPPAVLFFAGGEELPAERLIGFADAAGFAALLERVEARAR